MIQQTELLFRDAPPATVEPRVLTYRQFAVQGGYDTDMSHDRLRFPHGISKRQARDNQRAARHHLAEGLRALKDYANAVSSGAVRPPTSSEERFDILRGHPDHESVRAAWRLALRQKMRRGAASAVAAAKDLLAELFDGADQWTEEIGGATPEEQAAARVAWCGFDQPAQ